MLYKELNDYELVYMVSERNDDGYELIYKKYYPLIKKIAMQYYSIWSNIGLEKEDLIQSGLYGLLKAANSFNDQKNAKFYTCVVVFAKREIERTIKECNRIKHSFINNSFSLQNLVFQDDDVSYDEIIGGCWLEDEYVDYVSQKRILDFKYDMKSEHAQIYELRLAGFSCKDISILLDIKYKSVDNCLMIIKNKVKNMLSN